MGHLPADGSNMFTKIIPPGPMEASADHPLAGFATPPALSAMRGYQQELEDVALAQRSPRLANLALALKQELHALAQLAEVAEAARLLITEGLRLTPDALIVREKADRSDPHYRLCVALEDAGLIPASRRAHVRPEPPQVSATRNPE